MSIPAIGTDKGPQRRERRRTHLDVSVLPVEQALMARFNALIEHAGNLRAEMGDDSADADTYACIAHEFRTLAEELHWH